MPDFRNSTVEMYPTAYAPISGNKEMGAGCFDPSTREALYATIVSGRAECWRTTAGYRSLVQGNNSVTFLSAITDTATFGSIINPATVSVQRIGGVVYANITGKTTLATTGRMGHWIYKDTSAAADGSGPWTLHGTAQDTSNNSDGHYGVTGDDLYGTNNYAGGEILVSGSTWATGAPIFFIAGGGTNCHNGITVSTDGGVTWAVVVTHRYGSVAPRANGYRQSRSFGRIGDGWYWSSTGNVSENGTYKSSDLVTWTNVGSYGFADTGPAYPFSLSGRRLYRTQRGIAWESTTEAVETPATWSAAFDTTGTGLATDGNSVPQVANIGPDSRPLFAAFNRGTVLGLGESLRRPTVGRIGFR